MAQPMNKISYFKDLVLEKAEQYKNEELYGETIEYTIACEFSSEGYSEINQIINEKIDEIIDQYIKEMERKAISFVDKAIYMIMDNPGNREWLQDKILDDLEAVEELKDILDEIKYLSRPENIKKIMQEEEH